MVLLRSQVRNLVTSHGDWLELQEGNMVTTMRGTRRITTMIRFRQGFHGMVLFGTDAETA